MYMQRFCGATLFAACYGGRSSERNHVPAL